ncbi:hypothetical protein DQ384_01515 [Sphaerisporangium album]|uniref:Uncharacterized protein n=1 Tax=Sphaerisporangium album TaxID=509200 RepID=A0A367FU67_9ACTN|nr:hypothetical protein DQ384_01515 [Sphaerisporangium album]
MAVYFLLFCGLIVAGLLLFAPLPVWTRVAVGLSLAAVGILFARAGGGRRSYAPPLPLPEPYVPVPRPEPQERQVMRIRLPSAEDDYDFLFSATVRWTPIGVVDNPSMVGLAGLAVEAILDRARSVTEKRDPARASLVQHELNGILGRMQPDRERYLNAMADSVTLALSDSDQERLDRLAGIRKEKAVWEHERKHEQSKRDYLGEDVLKDPGSAVVWYLARNDDQVERAVKDIGLLAQLSSAANNADVPERFQHLVPFPVPVPAGSAAHAGDGEANGRPSSAADHFAAFLRAAGFTEEDPKRVLYVQRNVLFLSKQGKGEVADDLARRFDVPSPAPGDPRFPRPGEPPFPPPPDDLYPPPDGPEDDPGHGPQDEPGL